MARDIHHITRALRSYLPEGRTITRIKTLSAGHSNETYLLEGLNRILRMPPLGEGLLPPYDMKKQYDVLAALKKHSDVIPLPDLYELCTDANVIGAPFFIMECVPGEAFEYKPPEWLRADPVSGADRICQQLFDWLIALHNMEADCLPTGGRNPQEEGQYWLGVASESDADSILIKVLEELARNPPKESGLPTPVHGDPKAGNCLWVDGRLTAVLDWEIAQRCDPMIDLAFVTMHHDQGEAGVVNAGFDLPGWWSREKMIEEWELGTGRTAVDSRRWELLTLARAVAMIARGHKLSTSGKSQDAKLKAFGSYLPPFLRLLNERANKYL